MGDDEASATALSDLAAELAEAFRRLRPQGSAEWNVSDAFGRLEAVVAGLAASSDEAVPAGRRSGMGRRARDEGDAGLRELRRALSDGLDATLEAIRFLLVRLERLERAAELRRAPVDGLAGLAEPVDLEWWIEPVAEWVAGVAPHGPVAVGDCGDGLLAAELASHGLVVRASEPRAEAAWRSAERGLVVHLGPVEELLRECGPGTLGGAVLADVVDRRPVEDLVELLNLALGAMQPAAPIVILGRHPDRATVPPVVRDLVPGRPLHPETWALLLERAGCADVGHLDDPGENGPAEVYCVRGLRGR